MANFFNDKENIEKMYAFLSQQGQWQTKADETGAGNGDGMLVKSEFSYFIEHNLQDADLEQFSGYESVSKEAKKKDLINKFWEAIDTKRTIKHVGATRLYNQNALDDGEVDKLNANVEKYNALNKILEEFLSAEGSNYPASLVQIDQTGEAFKAWQAKVRESLTNEMLKYEINTVSDIDPMIADLQAILPSRSKMVLADIFAQHFIDVTVRSQMLQMGFSLSEIGDVTHETKDRKAVIQTLVDMYIGRFRGTLDEEGNLIQGVNDEKLGINDIKGDVEAMIKEFFGTAFPDNDSFSKETSHLEEIGYYPPDNLNDVQILVVAKKILPTMLSKLGAATITDEDGNEVSAVPNYDLYKSYYDSAFEKYLKSDADGILRGYSFDKFATAVNDTELQDSILKGYLVSQDYKNILALFEEQEKVAAETVNTAVNSDNYNEFLTFGDEENGLSALGSAVAAYIQSLGSGTVSAYDEIIQNAINRETKTLLDEGAKDMKVHSHASDSEYMKDLTRDVVKDVVDNIYDMFTNEKTGKSALPDGISYVEIRSLYNVMLSATEKINDADKKAEKERLSAFLIVDAVYKSGSEQLMKNVAGLFTDNYEEQIMSNNPPKMSVEKIKNKVQQLLNSSDYNFAIFGKTITDWGVTWDSELLKKRVYNTPDTSGDDIKGDKDGQTIGESQLKFSDLYGSNAIVAINTGTVGVSGFWGSRWANGETLEELQKMCDVIVAALKDAGLDLFALNRAANAVATSYSYYPVVTGFATAEELAADMAKNPGKYANRLAIIEGTSAGVAMVSFTDLANDIIAKYYSYAGQKTNDDYKPSFYVSPNGTITFVNYDSLYGAFNKDTENSDLNNLFNTIVKENLENKYKKEIKDLELTPQGKANLFNMAMLSVFSNITQYVTVDNMTSIEGQVEEKYGQLLQGADKEYLNNYNSISLLAGRTPSTSDENHEGNSFFDGVKFLNEIYVDGQPLYRNNTTDGDDDKIALDRCDNTQTVTLSSGKTYTIKAISGGDPGDAPTLNESLQKLFKKYYELYEAYLPGSQIKKLFDDAIQQAFDKFKNLGKTVSGDNAENPGATTVYGYGYHYHDPAWDLFDTYSTNGHQEWYSIGSYLLQVMYEFEQLASDKVMSASAKTTEPASISDMKQGIDSDGSRAKGVAASAGDVSDVAPTFYVANDGSIKFVSFDTGDGHARHGVFNDEAGESGGKLNTLFDNLKDEMEEEFAPELAALGITSADAKKNLFNRALFVALSDTSVLGSQYVVQASMKAVTEATAANYAQMLQSIVNDIEQASDGTITSVLRDYLTSSASILAGRNPAMTNYGNDNTTNSDVRTGIDKREYSYNEDNPDTSIQHILNMGYYTIESYVGSVPNIYYQDDTTDDGDRVVLVRNSKKNSTSGIYTYNCWSGGTYNSETGLNDRSGTRVMNAAMEKLYADYSRMYTAIGVAQSTILSLFREAQERTEQIINGLTSAYEPAGTSLYGYGENYSGAGSDNFDTFFENTTFAEGGGKVNIVNAGAVILELMYEFEHLMNEYLMKEYDRTTESGKGSGSSSGSGGSGSGSGSGTETA